MKSRPKSSAAPRRFQESLISTTYLWQICISVFNFVFWNNSIPSTTLSPVPQYKLADSAAPTTQYDAPIKRDSFAYPQPMDEISSLLILYTNNGQCQCSKVSPWVCCFNKGAWGNFRSVGMPGSNACKVDIAELNESTIPRRACQLSANHLELKA